MQGIADLLRAVEHHQDGTGALATVARLLEDLKPSLLLLADSKGNVFAADYPNSELDADSATSVAEELANRLADGPFCTCEIADANDSQTAFGVRLTRGDEWELFGGTICLTETAQNVLAPMRATLVTCGELASVAVRSWAERRKVYTENKHLRAEHSTLRAAHTESMIEAIQEREERMTLESQQLALEQFLQAAERASQSKSDFIAGMSHEIRTPMTAIMGFADVLLESLKKPENVDAATTIRRNGEYLLEIINDILDISKIEAGKLEVERVPCSPQQIIADVASLMKVRARAKGLELIAQHNGPIPETVTTDPTRTRQILINLVGNAVKFTDSGEVRLVVQLVHGFESETRLQFDVVDTGIGMTQEQITGLFRPFTQADISTTRKFGGTGLGLAISRRLAEKLGGDISVTSAPGRGSTFRVTIATGPLGGVPMLDGPPEEIVEKKPRNASRPKPEVKLDCRILLAEDSPDSQRLLAFFLRKAGAEVAIADNGKVAMEMALAATGPDAQGNDRPEPFDVVLMDIDMPVMNGLEATRRLRQEGYRGPIIALTAHTLSHHIQQCLDAGCNHHVSKPIDRNKLTSTVARFAKKVKVEG
ncbi:MAG: response regulator [Candidatus Nealsonbacteria bacterium]|nr:response regulator [Candidatus Nealsonbacteria bacterium]